MNRDRKKINVIIIDASAVTRYLLAEILEQTGDIEVVASVHNSAEALNKIQDLRPHVVTIDIASPGINGLAFLEKLREFQPTPVVIVSAINHHQSDALVKAMELGAVSYVSKQTSQSWSGILNLADEIVAKVRSASTVQFQRGMLTGGQPSTGNF